jgi:hypothetical protein
LVIGGLVIGGLVIGGLVIGGLVIGGLVIASIDWTVSIATGNPRTAPAGDTQKQIHDGGCGHRHRVSDCLTNRISAPPIINSQSPPIHQFTIASPNPQSTIRNPAIINPQSPIHNQRSAILNPQSSIDDGFHRPLPPFVE